MENERDTKSRKSATDPIFKRVMLTLFQAWDVDIQTEVEVGLASLRIDAVVGVRIPDIFSDLPIHTPFGHFRNDNILEFKGLGDPLTIDDVYRIAMRSFHYFLERKVSVFDLTVTIICARTPRKVLSHPGFGFQKRAEGYYLCHAFDVPVCLIATNELPIEPMYHSLLLFASSKVKIQPIIEDIVKHNAVQFFFFVSLLHPKVAQEVLKMAKRRDRIEESVKILAEGLGARLVPYINPEDRLRDLTPEQRLAGLDAEQRLAGLDAEQRLAGLDAEQRLAGLDAEQRLTGLSLEDRINGLSDEDRQVLRQLLDDQDNDT